jgi:hypothetical protein
MKKILLGAALLSLISCGSSSNVGSTANGAAKVLNIASVITEILGLIGGTGNAFTNTQTANISSALTKYIGVYNSANALTDLTARATQLGQAKTTALDSIKSAVSATQYTGIINSLTSAIGSKSTSASTALLLSSLVK